MTRDLLALLPGALSHSVKHQLSWTTERRTIKYTYQLEYQTLHQRGQDRSAPSCRHLLGSYPDPGSVGGLAVGVTASLF